MNTEKQKNYKKLFRKILPKEINLSTELLDKIEITEENELKINLKSTIERSKTKESHLLVDTEIYEEQMLMLEITKIDRFCILTKGFYSLVETELNINNKQTNIKEVEYYDLENNYIISEELDFNNPNPNIKLLSVENDTSKSLIKTIIDKIKNSK